MARAPKTDVTTQDTSTYCIIDTRLLKGRYSDTPTHKKVGDWEDACLKASVSKLSGYRFLESHATVDVAGYSSENPKDCEVTFTYTVTMRPSSPGSVKDVNPDRGIPYPEPGAPAV